MHFRILQINEKLRLLLAGLENYLGIKLDQTDVDLVFEDKEKDSISFKEYSFYREKNFFFPDWEITGAVDEYEPETLYLKSRGGLGKKEKFDMFFANLVH